MCVCVRQVVEHVAGYLGLDATLVRERNFMYPKDLPAHPYAAPTLLESSASAVRRSTKIDAQNCNGKAEHLNMHSQSDGGSLAKKDEDATSNRDGVAPKGDKPIRESHGKREGIPDVVCGRFQFKEAEEDRDASAVMSEGR